MSHLQTCSRCHGLRADHAPRSAAPDEAHDLTQVRRAGLLATHPLGATVLADSGFAGLLKDLLHPSLVSIHKAQREHPLFRDHNHINAELSAQRVIVKKIICQLKRFAISRCFRHSGERCQDAISGIFAAIANRRTQACLAV